MEFLVSVSCFFVANLFESITINMTYNCHVWRDMIYTERGQNEDRQVDRNTVGAVTGRENYGTGAGRTV